MHPSAVTRPAQVLPQVRAIVRALGRTVETRSTCKCAACILMHGLNFGAHSCTCTWLRSSSPAEIRPVPRWPPQSANNRSGNCLEIATVHSLSPHTVYVATGRVLSRLLARKSGTFVQLREDDRENFNAQRDDSNARNVDRLKMRAAVYQARTTADGRSSHRAPLCTSASRRSHSSIFIAVCADSARLL